ncbi:glycosyltransferase [uncultured Streptomyces sp.]|uniref:glycosyltransferase family 2 protein n=1 Tax=uncultured Streptomyces sp. TaxID=174707 RepID=UPI00260D9283|nr:glycosyltransferase [uncultured Streptomyces sp.]
MAHLKVSIVVPVYNAGPYIERCAPSLTEQSIGADAYEVVYVDDGSTDDSLERLRLLAERHPHVRVLHQENSGWPGKPRNVGIAAARGEYIQLVDQDDELAPEALERLYAMGKRNGSDIVMGKMAGTMVGPSAVFRRSRERCTVEDAPLIETLTAHRMFRREFLVEHDLRFPEGYWRMEDLLFMVQAYPKAKTVSILADYPCYFWNRREDGGNHSTAAYDLVEDYGRLRTVIGALRDSTEPGELQDRLMRRLYRVETMSRIGEPYVTRVDDEARLRAYEIIRPLALEAFPPGVRAGMPAMQKLRATLLEDGRPDSLLELARRVQAVKPRLDVSAAEQDDDGRLTLHVRATFHRADGSPLTLVEQDGRYVLDPRFTEGIEGAEGLVVEDPLAYANGEILVNDGRRKVWWHAEDTLVPHLEAYGEDGESQVVVEGDVVLDPTTLAGGEPLRPGAYEVWMGVQVLGVGRRPRLNPYDTEQRVALASKKLGGGARTVRPEWSGPGKQLRLVVRNPPPPPKPKPPVAVQPPPKGLRRVYRGVLRRLSPKHRKAVRRLAASAASRLRRR